uniref:ribosomal protein L27 n=1 Tax=Caulacanthus ustulatus TaxID=31411 RepID=UPI0027DA3FE3|nr:ribosomal protein L27 [Caulacanthus ustulatus]WCH57235.1 ribosomal protein L27 [Caulacanthus ustulatus]
MAHKKGSGSTKNGRDSNSKRLGIKKYGGEHVTPGNIIVRQRGGSFKAGSHTKIGKDFTIFAIEKGKVKFQITNKKNKIVHVTPTSPTIL